MGKLGKKAQAAAKKLGRWLDTNIPKVFNTIIGQSAVDVARENTDKTIQAQLDQQKFQNDYNYRMWQEQNAYNTPSAQMERLAAAGLNPNLVYGSGSVVGNAAERAPSSATADLNYNYAALQLPQAIQVLNMFQDFRQKQAAINQTEVVTQKILTDASLNAWKQRLLESDVQFKNESMLDRIIYEHYKQLNERAGLHLRENQYEYQKKETEDFVQRGIARNTPFLQRQFMTNPHALDQAFDILIQNFIHLFGKEN